jgi:hypothetical protein
MNHIHIQIHRWVAWWLALGVIFGAIALVNILLRDLTHTQEKVIVFLGVLHWVLGGLVCWTLGSAKIAPTTPTAVKRLDQTDRSREWHPASDFVLPGGRKSILPPSH